MAAELQPLKRFCDLLFFEFFILLFFIMLQFIPYLPMHKFMSMKTNFPILLALN